MHTTATLYLHPAAATPFRTFEIRRLAREYGCSFATTKLKPNARTEPPKPIDPNGGGYAA